MSMLKGPEEMNYLRTRERSFLPSDAVLSGVPDYDPFRDRHLERWYHRQRDNSQTHKRKNKARQGRHSPLISSPQGAAKTRLVAPIKHRSSPPPPVDTDTRGPPTQQYATITPQQRHSPNLSPKQAFLTPIDDQQRVVACKQHPELPATVFSEKFGFLCFQCDVFLHRTWRTAKLKRTPVAQILDPESASTQTQILNGWMADPTAGNTQPAGTLLQGDSALEQLLAMEAHAKQGKNSRLLNGQFVPSYSKSYKKEQQAKYDRQQQAAALGSEKAVRLVQKWIRGSLARAHVRRLRALRAEEELVEPMNEAAALIQGVYRGRAERKHGRLTHNRRMKQQFDTKAAQTIQASARGRFARKKLALKNAAANVIQRAWRGYWGRRMASRIATGQEDAEKGASILLQSMFRGHSQRKQRAEQQEAARRIQRIQRGKAGRRKAVLFNEEKSSHVKRDEAAVQVQRVFRGRTCRMTVDVYKNNQKNMWGSSSSLAQQRADREVNNPKEKGPQFPWEVLGSLHIRDLRFQDETRRMNRERDSMAERVRASVQSAVDIKEAEKLALQEEKDSIIRRKEADVKAALESQAEQERITEDQLKNAAVEREAAIEAKEDEIRAMTEERTKAEKEMRMRHMDEKEECIQENEQFQAELRQRQREEMAAAEDEFHDAKTALEDKLVEANATNERMRAQMNQQLEQMKEVAKGVAKEHTKALEAKDLEMKKQLQKMRETNRAALGDNVRDIDEKQRQAAQQVEDMKEEIAKAEREMDMKLQMKDTEMRVALELKEVEVAAQIAVLKEQQDKTAAEGARMLELAQLEAQKALELKDQNIKQKEMEMQSSLSCINDNNLKAAADAEMALKAKEEEMAKITQANVDAIAKVKAEMEAKAKVLEDEKARAVGRKEAEVRANLDEFENTQASSREERTAILKAKEEELDAALKARDEEMKVKEQQMCDQMAELQKQQKQMLDDQAAQLSQKDQLMKQAVDDKEEEMRKTQLAAQHEALAMSEVGSSALYDKEQEMRAALSAKDRDLEDRERAITQAQKQMESDLADAHAQKTMLELEVQAMRAASSRAVLAASRVQGGATQTASASSRRRRIEDWKTQVLDLCSQGA